MTMYESDLFSFGALLKAFRTRRHLTQQQLGEKLGVRRNTIGTWEQGDFLPQSKGIVLELAKHLCLDDQESRQLLEASLTALTPHWSVPFPRNLYFTGREEILEALHTQLGVDHTVALTQSAALHGLGGVGKTQIALEYAYRHALEYSAVFWIGAETEGQIVASILCIAEVLQLPGRDDTDQQRVITAVQRWLSTHNQWLLIWDNGEELALLDHFLPSIRQGAMLITTRRQVLGTLAQGIDLSPMEPEEGVLFLFRRAKILPLEATQEHLQHLAVRQPDTHATAEELVKIMGGLPLALDQAGAYIEETGCGLKGYVQRYTCQRSLLQKHRGSSLGADHPQSVTTTFTLTCERIEREQPAAFQLLQACAFLSPEAIPEELFVVGAVHLGPELAALVGHPTQFDQAIAALRSLSLLQRHPETQTLSMHRLVQEVLRDSLETSIARQWSERVIKALTVAFPEPDFVHWQRCERYILHARMSLQLISQAHLGMLEARALFLKAGSYVLERGDYGEAERFLIQAYTLGKDQPMDADLTTANVLDRLATLYWRQAKYQQAEQLFQRALSIGEHCLGSNHPDTGLYLDDLSLLYLDQGKYQQAEIFQQRALTLAECQANLPDLAQCLDNMARILQAQGKYTQAEQFYQRALAIWEDLPEPLPPNMTFCLNNLGLLYIKQQKYNLAEPLLQRALTMRQQFLGADHPRTAVSLQNLAKLFREQGKYEEATQMLQGALRIFEQRAGIDRFYLASALANLGVLSQIQGQDKQANLFFTQALTIQEQDLGREHPDTADTLYDLAIFRQKQGNLSEAIALAERVLKIRAAILGDMHSDTIAAQALYNELLCVRETAASQNHAAEPPDSHGTEQFADETPFPFQRVDDHSPLGNDPLEEFLTACCERHPLAWCRSADLWRAYQEWIAEQHERYSLSRGAFITQLKAHGCYADRTKTARIWRGLALVSKQDDGG